MAYVEEPPAPLEAEDIDELRITVPNLQLCLNQLHATLDDLNYIMANTGVEAVPAPPMDRVRVNLERAIQTLALRINVLQEHINEFDRNNMQS